MRIISNFKIMLMLLVLLVTVMPAAADLSADRTLPSSVNTGAEFNVTIDVAEYGEFAMINETLPSGFDFVGLVSTDNIGATDKGSYVEFYFFGIDNFTYTLEASSTKGTYPFSGFVNDSVNVSSIGGVSSIKVSSATTSTSGGSSGGSGGGGGGGGGGSSGEAYENIAHKAVMSQYINKDADVSYEFDNEENGISHISFVSLRNSGSITATVEVLNGRSAFANTDAPGKVYQKMNIWVGKAGFATDQNIENPTIGFKVEKSWLGENGIDVSSIRLCRYNDDAWNSLPTEKTDEDDEYVYFEANTPGFSPFAITSIAEESEGSVDVTPEVNTPVDSEGTETESEATPESESEESPKTPGFGALIATGIIAVAYFVQRRK